MGLGGTPVGRPSERGQFKVPTLRNVAVTAPYMHNGTFQDLTTVMQFYNKYLVSRPLNPETGRPWGAAVAEENLSHALLREGQAMNEHLISALIAFMEALTDQRYEYLLEAKE